MEQTGAPTRGGIVFTVAACVAVVAASEVPAQQRGSSDPLQVLSARAIVLGPMVQRVELQPTSRDTLKNRFQRLAPNRRLFLWVFDVTVDGVQRIEFDVFLNRDGSSSNDAPDESTRLGTIPFRQFVSGNRASGRGLYHSLDITPIVERLIKRGALGDTTVLTFVPVAPVVASAVVRVGALEVWEQPVALAAVNGVTVPGTSQVK